MVKIISNVIYEDKTGYISGYLRDDGYYFITHFVIYPEFRNVGNAYKLAQHLPKKCKLLAYPLYNLDKEVKIGPDKLESFYEKIGFRKENELMVRD